MVYDAMVMISASTIEGRRHRVLSRLLMLPCLWAGWLHGDDAVCVGDGDRESSSLLTNETRLYVVNPASNVNRQSFLRFINRTEDENDVEVYGIDDSGRYSDDGPVTFTLAPRASNQITIQDLEDGNPGAGLDNELCDGQGKWQLRVRSEGPIEAMSLIRTPDGFLTSLDDVAPKLSGDKMLWFGNPASNTRRQTFLRIVNESESGGTVSITGIDDEGIDRGSVSFTIDANAARQLTAQDLENGAAGLTGTLDDGTGKWRFRISATVDIQAMSLIRTEDGFLSNLSALVRDAGDANVIYFANPASESAQQTFLRIMNNSDDMGTVTITAIDDAGMIAPMGSASLTLGPNEAKQVTIQDLENGHADLMGMLGDGAGRWRLTLSAPDLDLRVMSLIRTENGFLTNLGVTTAVADSVNSVWMINPASNTQKRSFLRLVNDSDMQGSVTIAGIDDAGNPGLMDVTFNIAGEGAMEITSVDLENGNSELALVGTLGDGNGKWRLTLTSDVELHAQSLLETPTGFLTNLSGTTSSVPAASSVSTVETDTTIATSRALTLRHVVTSLLKTG